MSDEKRRVLEMLEAGKITQEDAIRLLEALGENGGEKQLSTSVPAEQVAPAEPPSAAMEQAARNLSGTAEEAFREMAGGEEEGAMVPAKEARTGILPMPEAPKGGYEACPPPSPGEEHYEYRGGMEKLEAVDISWISGPVEVRAYDGQEVRVTEYAKHPLSEGQMLMMKLEDGKLTIRWSREKVNLGILNRSKHLIVELPREAAAHVEDFKCANVSGKVYVTDIAGEDFSISTTSGAIYAGGLTAEDLNISSVSGKLDAESISVENLHMNTTSGTIRIQNFAAEEARFDSVSGSIEASGNAEEFKLKTVSGSQHLAVAQCPQEAAFNSVSGSIHFVLPENRGFTAKYSSMSGRFETNFPVSGGTTGGKKGKVSYGSGDAEFTLGTMSGGMKLEHA